MFLYYIIIVIILCILIVHGYNKVRNKFWMTQPIFYRYSLVNWFRLNRLYNTDRPCDTIYLNLINNVVTHITDTSIPITINNIYINETERGINYYDDIVKLINKYPYFNVRLDNNNKQSVVINRKMNSDKLKLNFINHDYSTVVTMNKKMIYNTDMSSSDILSVYTVMGVVISIPYYCIFASSGRRNAIPIYYSVIYYDPREIQETHVIEMIQTHNYKIYDDWNRVLLHQNNYTANSVDSVIEKDSETNAAMPYVVENRIEKGVKRLTRENMLNSDKSKINNDNNLTNLYQENGLNISKNKSKIYASIYKYTGSSIPKIIVPFVIYHRFYIPISSQPSQDWHRIEYRFHPSIQLIKIGTENVTILYEFLESCYEGLNVHTQTHKSYKYKLPFGCCILPSLHHIFHMIKTELCSIYILLQKNNDVKVGSDGTNIISMYMFSNSDDTISNDINIDKRHMIYLTTSVMYGGDGSGGSDNKAVTSSFIYGFINALKLETNNKALGCVAIDTLAHNKPLIDFLIVNTKPLMVEKNNLIFYNYICNTFPPEQVMIMN